MRWLLRVITELLLITAVACLPIWFGWYAVWPAALIVGIRYHALGVLGHLGSHRVTGLSARVNDFLTKYVAFGPLGIDLHKYRLFHGAHHNNLGILGKDPEVEIVQFFKERWTRYRWWDSALDAIGLHSDEMLFVMSYMITPRSMLMPAAFLLLFTWIDPLAGLTLVLASMTGFVLAHRLRAFTEHDHLRQPGATFKQNTPALWRRAFYLPHGTWLHWEHHEWPGVLPVQSKA